MMMPHGIVTLFAFAGVALQQLVGSSGVGAEPVVALDSNEGFCRQFDSPWDKGACTVDADGNQRGHCRRCFLGPEWDALREEIGTHRVSGKRKAVPSIALPNWPSAAIIASAFRMVAQELLGYEDVIVFSNAGSVDAADEVEECGAIHMEVWDKGGSTDLNATASLAPVIKSELGDVGREGLYIPEYMPFKSAFHDALKNNYITELLEDGTALRALDAFPADGSFGPGNLSDYSSPPHFFCSPEVRNSSGWTQSDCDAGRWYPAQCGTEFPSPHCREMYMATLPWSGGWFEAVTQNLGLNFSLVYAGYQGLTDTVAKMHEEKRPILHYWWEPDALLVKFPSIPVLLPPYTAECGETFSEEPLESGVDCARESTPLKKMIRRDVHESEPDLAALFDNWHVGRRQMLELLSLHSSGGGDNDIEDAACAFLTSASSSFSWKTWLQVTPPPAEDTEAGDFLDPTPAAPPTNRVMIKWVTGLLIGLMVGAAAFFAWHKCRRSKSMEGDEENATRGKYELRDANKQFRISNGESGVVGNVAENRQNSASTSQNSLVIGQRQLTQHSHRAVRRCTSRGDFKLLEIVGKGGSALVYRGVWQGVVVAVKICTVREAHMDGTDAVAEEGEYNPALFSMEMAICEVMRHPNVVRMYSSELVPVSRKVSRNGNEASTSDSATRKLSDGVMSESTDDDKDVPDETTVYNYWKGFIIQEYCSQGSLSQALKKGKLEGQGKDANGSATAPNLSTSITLALDIARGLAYIHSMQIIHGDVKASNVLLATRDDNDKTDDCACVAKIADFGLAKQLAADETHLSGVFAGTITHLAPEALRNGRQSMAADVYAFGIVLFELFTAQKAYKGMSSVDIIELVVHKRKRPVFPHGASMKVVELFAECTSQDPSHRPTMEDVVAELVDLLNVHTIDPKRGAASSLPTSRNSSRSHLMTPGTSFGVEGNSFSIDTRGIEDDDATEIFSMSDILRRGAASLMSSSGMGNDDVDSGSGFDSEAQKSCDETTPVLAGDSPPDAAMHNIEAVLKSVSFQAAAGSPAASSSLSRLSAQSGVRHLTLLNDLSSSPSDVGGNRSPTGSTEAFDIRALQLGSTLLPRPPATKRDQRPKKPNPSGLPATVEEGEELDEEDSGTWSPS